MGYLLNNICFLFVCLISGSLAWGTSEPAANPKAMKVNPQVLRRQGATLALDLVKHSFEVRMKAVSPGTTSNRTRDYFPVIRVAAEVKRYLEADSKTGLLVEDGYRQWLGEEQMGEASHDIISVRSLRSFEAREVGDADLYRALGHVYQTLPQAYRQTAAAQVVVCLNYRDSRWKEEIPAIHVGCRPIQATTLEAALNSRDGRYDFDVQNLSTGEHAKIEIVKTN